MYTYCVYLIYAFADRSDMPVLNWIGKEKVVNHHLDVPYRVLEHTYGFNNGNESKQFSGSGNKIIHGDNLEALKALLPEYEGKIKCIYIDPPYNTGNENWVYNDNVNDPKIMKWLGQVVGKESEDLTRHDKWLCMMYPRLKLLHKLLADDGAIFISIDDNEQANLKLMMDEIFGGGNFIASIPWKGKGGGADNKYLMVAHEYIVFYGKSKTNFIIGEEEKTDESFPKFDSIKKQYYKTQLLRKWGATSKRTDRPNLYYPIKSPDGNDHYPILPNGEDGCWRWGKETMNQAMSDGLVEFVKKDDTWIAYEKIFKPINGLNTKKYSTWFDFASNNAEGSKELKSIFSEKQFDFPKPNTLIEILLKIANLSNNDIILDSFAGSGTTAHAVLNLNKQDGGNRKFILIEMEEYANSITAERVKRVIKGYSDKEGTGGSFDYYELGQPLFNDEGELNELVGIGKLREYIYYTETKEHLGKSKCIDNDYLLDKYNDTVYYFFYEEDSTTTLNYEFLSTIKTKAEQYIVYADNCLLSKEFMSKHHIIFKKIPRDITKF